MIGKLLVQESRNEVIFVIPWGDTEDIMKVIVGVSNKDLEGQVKEFAQQFKGRSTADQYEKLEKLWRFTKYKIKYRADKDKEPQRVRHPANAYLVKDLGVDCKSKTLFNYFVMKALGIPCFIRFAAYKYNANRTLNKAKDIGHVYPVAILDGRPVAVDSVYDYFDAEEKAVKIIDKFPSAWDSPGIRALAKESKKAAIGGIGHSSPPTWVLGSFAVVSGIQAFRAKTFLEKLLYGGLSVHFARQTIRQQWQG